MKKEKSFEPKIIIEARTKQLQTQNITEYLIKWKNLVIEDVAWEDKSCIQKNKKITNNLGQHMF